MSHLHFHKTTGETFALKFKQFGLLYQMVLVFAKKITLNCPLGVASPLEKNVTSFVWIKSSRMRTFSPIDMYFNEALNQMNKIYRTKNQV